MNLAELSKKKLQKLCDDVCYPHNGTKEELVARLEALPPSEMADLERAEEEAEKE